MGNIKYLVQRILQMNYGSLFQTVEKLQKKTGRSRIGLLADIIQCGLRYGAGYKDYELCAFYDLTDDQRSTYVTRGINNRIVKLLNDPHYHRCMQDKQIFNRIYAPLYPPGMDGYDQRLLR